MAMEYSSRTIVATQYTGANGAEVLAMCQMVTQYTNNVWSIDSDTGTKLVLRETSPLGPVAFWPVELNIWVVVAPDFGIVARLGDAQYRARYRALSAIIGDAVTASMPDIVTAVVASNALKAAATTAAQTEAAKAMYGGFGLTVTPAMIVAGGSSFAEADVAVTLTPAQKDVGFRAQAYISATNNVLSSLSISSVTITSASVVTVRLRTTGVLVAGAATVFVHITAPTAAAPAGGAK